MLTKDERDLMVATICLHGFDLYEWFPSTGVWRPLLAGARDSQGRHDCIMLTSNNIGMRGWQPKDTTWQRHHWFKLHDRELVGFHRTVISTC